ncbi:MAG: hypothetical protein Q8L48_40015 [Archangium sp.]|nr:hypothetical protein [Archangium sp.]
MLATVGDQMFLIARPGDAAADPDVFLLDHDELDDRSHPTPLSQFLSRISPEPLVAPAGVSFEAADAHAGRVLLRVHARTTDPDTRARMKRMAARLGLGQIGELRMAWGELDFGDLLGEPRFWQPLFAAADRAGTPLWQAAADARRSTEVSLRVRAVTHLAHHHADVGVIAPWLRDPDAVVVVEAARAIGRVGRQADRGLVEPLLKDKRPDVFAAALVALVALAGPAAADVVWESVTRRPAEASMALLRSMAAPLSGTVPGETLADFVAWARDRQEVQLRCDLTSPARAGRLRAKISDRVTLVRGRPAPAELQAVLEHFARTLGVAVYAPTPDRVELVEPTEGARLWRERLAAAAAG